MRRLNPSGGSFHRNLGNVILSVAKDLRVRPAYLIVLLAVVVIGGRVAWLRAHREARTIASTTCPFFGPPRVTMVSDMQPWDTMPTRAHEDVHAEQCRSLGPVRYRVRNLTAAGKLSLEAPAFCAAAVARMRVDPDSSYASERLHTDMIEGLSDVADSTTIKRSLLAACPVIAAVPRRTMPRRRR